MIVQINKEAPFLFDISEVKQYPALLFSGETVIAVDQSKTNTAIIAAAPNGEIRAILQLSAPGYKNDNSEFCRDFKIFLRHFLQNVSLYDVGIEATITSKRNGNYHTSQILEQIRSNLVSLFYEDFGIKPREIDNQIWKRAVLPYAFRGKDIKKGSVLYLPELYRLYGNADVTDAMCILEYILSGYRDPFTFYCSRRESLLCPVNVTLLKRPEAFPAKAVRFNVLYSFTDNVAFYANRFAGRCIMHVPVSALTLEDVYNCRTRFTEIPKGKEVSAVFFRSG